MIISNNKAKQRISKNVLAKVLKLIMAAAGMFLPLTSVCVTTIGKTAGKQPIDYVDTRIGTQRWSKTITVSQAEDPSGFVYPGVGEPFAMTEWTPQTSVVHMAHVPVQVPYWWDEGRMQGFRGTHYPNGAVMNDYGCLTIMPMTGTVYIDAKSRASAYRHDTEIAKPHYYAVTLDDYKIKAEITAANQTGFFRFTFPQSDSASVLIDPVFSQYGGFFRVNPENNEIEGISYKTGMGVNSPGQAYFVARFDKKFKDFGVYKTKTNANAISAKHFPQGNDSPLVQELKGEYYSNGELSGEPTLTRIDKQLDFAWSSAPADGLLKNVFSIRWTGKIIPRKNGIHTLTLTHDDGARLYINGRLLIDDWIVKPPANIETGKGLDINSMANRKQVNESNVAMLMQKGREYDLRIEYRDDKGPSKITIDSVEPEDEGEATKDALSGARGEAVYVSFNTSNNETVKVKIGTSFISTEQARMNMEREISDWDFDKAVNRTKQIWSKALGKIEVEGTDEDKTIFYTALQRAMLLPRNMTEGGIYRSPFDGMIHNGDMYTDFSIWDTFRAEHPLLIFLEPERVSGMLRALLNAYDQGGWIPKWPNPGYSNVMMATHGDSVIAEAYIKGIRGFDANKAYEAMLKNASTPGDRGYEARDGILDYIKLGYVPADKYSESVACTMEYAYDDYCVAQMAKALGKDEDYRKFIARALNYKNVLDPETKLIRGRISTGEWRDPGDHNISVWARGTERDLKVYKWNYTVFAPQDPQGIINFFGGKSGFVDFMDNFFDDNLYYVGDEFSMHAPYLYDFAGEPWKTQKHVRALLDYYFAEGPGGMCGNDDAGQLSSWYLFGAMGFYPVSPAMPVYMIGSPVFNKITLHLENGKSFVIEAKNNSKTNVFIQSATLNGSGMNRPWLDHKQIMAGGRLSLNMGAEPNTQWGSDLSLLSPLSISKP